MKIPHSLTAKGLGLTCIAIALSSSALAETKKVEKGEKPAASPGWLVIEENFWVPWRYEPFDWFHNAQTHYRDQEEKAAASELRKAESWLNFAAGHALPMTKKSLEESAKDLEALAVDLDNGKVHHAANLDSALAKANRALAEWHYFKADESLARSEESDAAMNLQAAARYLRNAADSAKLEYGDEFVTVYDELSGWKESEPIPNTLKDKLATIKGELDKLSGTLKKDAKVKE
ncbi:MAG: hypothetical protein KDN22_25305 [Verrucomicrobiae bacterium]|nr:hypothetical protein [Verrucomicrobiae bacterium]